MEVQAKSSVESDVQMTELVLPTHTNSFGNIFGGTVMSWIDIAAAIVAQRHSQASVVTASIDDLHFIAPIKQGWVVNLKARINYVGKSSMEVGVRVEAENPITTERFHSVSAYLTFVALDQQGLPKDVPALLLETEEQKRRHQKALVRREQRLERRRLKLHHG